MRVLVTGAYGFIGSHIVAALVTAGHDVTCAVRGARLDTRFPGLKAVACDMARDTTPAAWLPRLEDVDAVVNCAGILRERAADSFEAVHVQAPQALYLACVKAGVRRVVQISALGNVRDGAFIASKHRGDEQLLSLPLIATILRPSVVYSARGSYGGTSLLRAMAALPWLTVVPRAALRPCIQPMAAEDVGLAVVAALEDPPQESETLELVGPRAMGLDDYLQCWRRWLGLPMAKIWAVPTACVKVISRLGEWLGVGPLGSTMQGMLERGNLGRPDALEHLHTRLNLTPRTLEHALAEAPSHVQDRWHARLYFALPLLRVSVALLWLGSGVVGWLLPPEAVADAAPNGLPSAATALMLARGTATLDLLLGALCLLRWRSGWVLAGMLLMLIGYTIGIGTLWPAHWLDPFGGLLKNLPLMAALIVLMAIEEKR
ncbi:NAD(P)H-binding protein [Dyella sp. Tek66A03]|uniref:NAD(P)H-binding protein n=1 Tax=Dyella sp. Tek66A03 TaxID=3458298 RepID=UPI00403E5D83